MYRIPPLTTIVRKKGHILAVPLKGSAVVLKEPGLAASILSALSLSTPGSAEQIQERAGCSSEALEREITKLISAGILELAGPLPGNNGAHGLSAGAVEAPFERIVYGVCGTAQAMNIWPMLIALRRVAKNIDIVLTDASQRFVNRDALVHYSTRVWTNVHETSPGIPVAHRFLATADLILIAPASAHTIHKIAFGECSDLLSLVVAATTSPVVIAPAMASTMMAHPPIQRNIEQLIADGYLVIKPASCIPLSSLEQAEDENCGPGLNPINAARVLASIALLRAHPPSQTHFQNSLSPEALAEK